MNTNDAVLLRVRKDNSVSFVTIFVTNRIIELCIYIILLQTKWLTNVEIRCDVDINLNSRNVEITLYHFQYYKITKANCNTNDAALL